MRQQISSLLGAVAIFIVSLDGKSTHDDDARVFQLVGCIDGSGTASTEYCSEATGEYIANVKDPSEMFSGHCWRNTFHHPACEKHDTSVSKLAIKGRLELHDRVALVPQGLCSAKFLRSLPDQRFGRHLYYRKLDGTDEEHEVHVRLPNTWGSHVACIHTRNDQAYEVQAQATIDIGCPSGWFGSQQDEDERAALSQILSGNFGAPNILARSFDVSDSPLSYNDAAKFCSAKDMRLCSLDEFIGNEGWTAAGTEMLVQGEAAVPSWSSTACDVDYATFTKKAGFFTALPETSCAQPDCDGGYDGERCWHDYKQREACTTFDPSNPASRHNCSEQSDWRHFWTAPDVTIPKNKVAGSCLNGTPCGNRLNLTVVDGDFFQVFDEIPASKQSSGPEPCQNFDATDIPVKDAWGNEDLIARGKLANHGAVMRHCTPHHEKLSRVTCCRGSMPLCKVCPFGLESPARATNIEQCSMCIKLCTDPISPNSKTTCACEDSDATLLSERAGEVKKPLGERFVAIQEENKGRRRTLQSDSGNGLAEGRALAENGKSCPANFYLDGETCSPCLFGLSSPANSVGAHSCTACMTGCTTSCGRETTCACSRSDINLTNAFGPLRERSAGELEFDHKEKGGLVGLQLSSGAEGMCRCISTCSDLEMCNVQSIDCTTLAGAPGPFWVQGGAAPDEFGFGPPTPTAFCTDISENAELDSPARDNCCSGQDEFYYIPAAGGMGARFDELLHPLREETKNRPVFQAASGTKYLIISENGKDTLAEPSTADCV